MYITNLTIIPEQAGTMRRRLIPRPTEEDVGLNEKGNHNDVKLKGKGDPKEGVNLKEIRLKQGIDLKEDIDFKINLEDIDLEEQGNLEVNLMNARLKEEGTTLRGGQTQA